LHHRQLALEGGGLQRRLAHVVGDRGVGAAFEQQPSRVEMAVVDSEHQQGVTLLIADIERQALVEHHAQFGGVAGTGDFKSALQKFEHLTVEVCGRRR